MRIRDEMMSRSALFRAFAAAGAAAVLMLAAAPAEAGVCPAGYYQCIKGGKAHSPRRCCPIATPKPVGTMTPPRPGARCLSAVRQPGPGGSVKIACVRWGSLNAPVTGTLSCG